MNPIATRHAFTLNRITGEKGLITFEISSPRAVDNGENYMCTVQITGVLHTIQDVGGIDSMQSLALAIKWTKNKFEELQKETYDFFWLEGAINPMKYFDYSE